MQACHLWFHANLETLQAVEAAYRDNEYHNAMHAADVVQSLGALLAPDGLAGQLTDLEMLSIIVAAAVHDVGHPGTTPLSSVLTCKQARGALASWALLCLSHLLHMVFSDSCLAVVQA